MKLTLIVTGFLVLLLSPTTFALSRDDPEVDRKTNIFQNLARLCVYVCVFVCSLGRGINITNNYCT